MLDSSLKIQEKKQKFKPKVSRQEEIRKVRADISELKIEKEKT